MLYVKALSAWTAFLQNVQVSTEAQTILVQFQIYKECVIRAYTSGLRFQNKKKKKKRPAHLSTNLHSFKNVIQMRVRVSE